MSKKQISAEIIADSKNQFGDRITTFIITFPRIVLAEFNTHRMLSRNSASSRAIPFKKMVKMVQEDPFIPIKWQKDHSGMQGTEYYEYPKDIERWEIDWLNCRTDAIQNAESLYSDGMLSKQLCNRLLEPFMWHTAIVTATEWENFFALRAHPQAEIHIAKLAEVMLEAYNESDPKQLKDGEWHIPFGDNMDNDEIESLSGYIFDGSEGGEDEFYQLVQKVKIKIATARCARVSYLNFEGKDDYEADIKLHDRLAEMGHWSPFEHCAQAMSIDEISPSVVVLEPKISEEAKKELLDNWNDFMTHRGIQWVTAKEDIEIHHINGSGNFKGFIQYRKTFQGENKKDNRVIKK